MKFIIIGLGNFGISLALKLTEMGHEVLGVDKQMEKVDEIKDKIAMAFCLDCKYQEAVNSLPLKNTDVVIVTIGEDEGANLLTTALLKKAGAPRLISRAVSPIHSTILEAMEISEIGQFAYYGFIEKSGCSTIDKPGSFSNSFNYFRSDGNI